MLNSTTFQIICIVMFTVTGTFGGLLNKWICLQNSEGSFGVKHDFFHPFVMTWFMFFAEILCGCLYYALYYYYKWKGEGQEDTCQITKGTREFSSFLVVPTVVLDLVGSACFLVGLNLTYISSLLMLKASQILFTALFSTIFLGRRLTIPEIFGMLLVFVGIVIVGFCDYCLTDDEQATVSSFGVAIGDLVIMLGNIFLAGVVVYQEKFYFTNVDIPVLQAVGLEGFFGIIMITGINIGLQFWYVGPKLGHNPRQLAEDSIDACLQINNHKGIFWGLLVNCIGIAMYNYSGLAIIRELSCLTMMILDNMKTIIMWILAIILLEQPFIWQSILGYVIVTYGMFLYNNISLYGTARRKTNNIE